MHPHTCSSNILTIKALLIKSSCVLLVVSIIIINQKLSFLKAKQRLKLFAKFVWSDHGEVTLPSHCIGGTPSEKSFSLQSSNICSTSQPSICSLFVCNGLFLELLQNHSEKRVTCAGNVSNTYFCCHPGHCLASMSLQDGRWTLCDITNNIFAPSTLLCLFIVCIIR